MELVVYDDDEKRYVPWAIALAAVLLVGLLTAGVTFLLARQASHLQDEPAVAGVSSPEPATTPPGLTATPAPACAAALVQADAALARSVALNEALAQHTKIMDELLAERIAAGEALDRTLPVLTDGSTERRRFEQELAVYSVSRQQCPS